MTIDNESIIKETIKHYAQFWAGGLIFAMIIGALISVNTADNLLLDMGYKILVMEVISGAFNCATAYFSASVGLVGLILLLYKKIDNEMDGFAFMRGFLSGFMFYVCWSGIYGLLKERPQTVAQVYENLTNDINSIPFTILTILVIGVFFGMATKFVSYRPKVN